MYVKTHQQTVQGNIKRNTLHINTSKHVCRAIVFLQICHVSLHRHGLFYLKTGVERAIVTTADVAFEACRRESPEMWACQRQTDFLKQFREYASFGRNNWMFSWFLKYTRQCISNTAKVWYILLLKLFVSFLMCWYTLTL